MGNTEIHTRKRKKFRLQSKSKLKLKLGRIKTKLFKRRKRRTRISNKKGGAVPVFCTDDFLKRGNFDYLKKLVKEVSKSDPPSRPVPDPSSGPVAKITEIQFKDLAESISENKVAITPTDEREKDFIQLNKEIIATTKKLLRSIFQTHKPTWKEFTSEVKKNNSCKYDIFRKNVVDFLLLYIIINLFQFKNIVIKNKDGQIYSHKAEVTRQSTPELVEITYEMVGSVDQTSDYDVTLYSTPPNPKITVINSIFNLSFQQVLQNSSGEIFDTNLYTHPVYFYKVGKYRDYLIKLTENKFFLNAGHAVFVENEKVFANLVHLPYYASADFKQKGKYPKFFEESSKGSTRDANVVAETVSAWNLKTPGIALYRDFCNTDESLESELDLGQQSESTTVSEGGASGSEVKASVSKGRASVPKARKSTNLSKASLRSLKFRRKESIPKESIPKESIPKESIRRSSIQDTNCYQSDDKAKSHNLRVVYEKIAIDFLKNVDTAPTGTTTLEKHLKTNYIGPMRVALYYADETYHTFSAYFHVIHCIATVKESENAIKELLTKPNIDSFINICKVSAAENFSFMIKSYVYTDVEYFKKKTAKYLARISHAIDLIKKLNDLKQKSTPSAPEAASAAPEAASEAASEAAAPEAAASAAAAPASAKSSAPAAPAVTIKTIIQGLNKGSIGGHDSIINKYKRSKPIDEITGASLSIKDIFSKGSVSEILSECYSKIEKTNSEITDILVVQPDPKLTILLEKPEPGIDV